MHRKPAHILFLLVGLGILLGIDRTVEAGFIEAAFESESTIAQFTSSAPAGSSLPQPAVPAPWEITHPGHWLAAMLGTLGSTGGMSAPGSSGSSSAPAAVLPPRSGLPPGLTLRLLAREEPFHPRFVKSRLFRPPRS
jgi:hypothetical protein